MVGTQVPATANVTLADVFRSAGHQWLQAHRVPRRYLKVMQRSPPVAQPLKEAVGYGAIAVIRGISSLAVGIGTVPSVKRRRKKSGVRPGNVSCCRFLTSIKSLRRLTS